ncbi:MAG: hypothetical protein HGB02_03790 [Chlorobiaceae bacterium]|nr:hypothetical protein [Chlorobiaceae bacterium]
MMIIHACGTVAADLHTMTLYVGMDSHTIRTRDDVMRFAGLSIGDFDIYTAAIDMAIQMLAVQDVVVTAQDILAEQREIDEDRRTHLLSSIASFVGRSWLVARLLLPFQ